MTTIEEKYRSQLETDLGFVIGKTVRLYKRDFGMTHEDAVAAVRTCIDQAFVAVGMSKVEQDAMLRRILDSDGEDSALS